MLEVHIRRPTSPFSARYSQPGNERRMGVRRRRVLWLFWILAVSLLVPFSLILFLQVSSTNQHTEHSGAKRYPWAHYAQARKQWRTVSNVSPGLSSLAAPNSRRTPETVSDETYLATVQNSPWPIKLKYPVLWCGALFSKSGYGTEALSYVSSLLQLGLVQRSDLWLSQSGDHVHREVTETMEPALRELLQEQDYRNMTSRLSGKDAARPVIVVCHSFPDCWRTPDDDSTSVTLKKIGRTISSFVKHEILGIKVEDSGCPCPKNDIVDAVVYRIGRTMFETEHLPAPLATYSQYVDEVWVPSDFGLRSFAQSGVNLDKIHVLPQGINTSLFQPLPKDSLKLDLTGGEVVAGRPRAPGSPEPFRFLSVFKWEKRKGWDVLLPAYVSEFRYESDVELHVLTKAAFEEVTDFFRYFRRHVGPLLNITKDSEWMLLPRVILHDRYIPEHEYPFLYGAMDCLVIPTRGEGWGRPQIEAMSMGLPVISTNWSGLTAFMTSETSYPIRVRGIVPVQDEGPNSFDWFQGQRWAEPDPDHLRQLMRSVFKDRDAAKRKGRKARDHIIRHFSERAVAQRLLAQILRVQDIVDDLLWGSDVRIG